ncbi:hypothetical protein [Massilia sp. CCM 8734]|uniref:hypothetical protein n=1 Tax=Massilia sp. CCM 8734 TaxID=2609283 RepID=UPI001421A931|nr:hypothetical protein [Massilia sp. CCM 8734]
MHQLAQHQQERHLISVSRSGIDNHSMEAIALEASEEGVLLQYQEVNAAAVEMQWP